MGETQFRQTKQPSLIPFPWLPFLKDFICIHSVLIWLFLEASPLLFWSLYTELRMGLFVLSLSLSLHYLYPSICLLRYSSIQLCYIYHLGNSNK